MQERRLELHEEQHLRGDSVGRAPDQPVLGIDADLKVDEARGERGRHAVDHAAVALAVAAGDERRALGQLVLADLAFERELIKSGLYHRHAGRQLFEVDEPEAGVTGRRQEHRRRPAGAVGGVAPGDASQVHGVEQERPDVDILAATVCRDLLRDHRFSRAGRSPHHSRLTGFDEKGEGRGELARAERVVRGNGCGLGHGWDSGMAGERRGHPPGARPSPRSRPCSCSCRCGECGRSSVAFGGGTAVSRLGGRCREREPGLRGSLRGCCRPGRWGRRREVGGGVQSRGA